MNNRVWVGLVTAAVVAGGSVSAQRGGAPAAGRGEAPQTPRAESPIDLTGYWVSIVNEEWRWRMITPPKGDITSVPLNARGRQVAEAWDPASDGSCQAYGAAALMRMPTRLRISWEGDNVLKIETDAGSQTRRLVFGNAATAAAPRSFQGTSHAEWQHTLPAGGGNGGFGPPPPLQPGGSLKVVTTNLRAGWLRKNGVPYSDDTTTSEYFDRFPAPDNTEWFVVTTIVNDPTYLQRPFTTSSHFRRESDGSKWKAKPCKGGA